MALPAFTYDVAETTPDAARDDICRLWAENLSLDTTPQEKFQWLYRDAPEPSTSLFVLRAKDAEGSERIVGTTGLLARRFQIGARIGRAAVNGDLAVELAHRGLLPALRLVRAAREHQVAAFDVGYGFPNPKADGVLARAGFRVLGKTTRYARVLRHATYRKKISERPGMHPVIARFAGDERVAEALGPVVDVARLALGAVGLVTARRRYRLVFASAFDAKFDTLWESSRHEYDVVGARTSSFLAWRYPSAEIATLVRRSDDALVAYAVIERDKSTGAAHLRDVFGHKEHLGSLIDLLLPALWRRRFTSVSVRFIGAPYLVAALAMRGFEPRAETRTVIVQVGVSAEADRARLEDASAWHLFDADEDA